MTSLHEKYSNYHYCIVPECKNTSIKTPGKLWIRVPSDKNMRNTWLKLAQRDPESLSTTTQLYFCEDHFDLKNDMENYIRYKIMGSVKRIRMKPGCVPSRFQHHSNKTRIHSPIPDQQEDDDKKIEMEEKRRFAEFPNEEGVSSSFSSSPEKVHEEAMLVIKTETASSLHSSHNFILMKSDNSSESDSLPSQQTTVRFRSRKRKATKSTDLSTDDDMLDSVNESSERVVLKNDDRLDLFGKYVALTLRELPKEQRILAEKIINDTLFQAEMGSLALPLHEY